MAAASLTNGRALTKNHSRANTHESVHSLNHHTSSVPTESFEKCLYHASVTRASERLSKKEFKQQRGPISVRWLLPSWFSSGSIGRPGPITQRDVVVTQKMRTEASEGESGLFAPGTTTIDSEWNTANRLTRIASWGSVAYLIVTDILGPSSAPWSFAQTGYGPGFALYTIFGLLSTYSGWILWRVFLELDSDPFPIRNFADIFMRLFGPGMKHLVNIAQVIQLIMVTGMVILMNGQAISQMSYGIDGTSKGLCFILCLLVFVLAGCVVGQIRTFQRLGWLANLALWLNLLIVLTLMGLVARYSPNFDATTATFGPQWGPAPIRTFAGTPPSGFATGGTVIATLNGLNQVMLCYGGISFSVFFLAEMRHPLDFWKSLVLAQAFIYAIYVVFGMYVYHWHGQFTYTPAVQGISNRYWQTALNAINLITSLITCGLYGNIAIKITYIELFEGALKFPSLASRTGKIWWVILTPIYWFTGFIVAAAIPQLAFISGLIAAVFSGGFTYILPALAAVGFWIQKGALSGTGASNPSPQTLVYADTGLQRYYRGFMKRPFFITLNIFYLIAGVALCVLGCYAAIHQLQLAFKTGVATSFTCKSPV